MRKLALACVSAAAVSGVVAAIAPAEAGYVHGYTRSNGTYVQGHYRSSPNQSYSDNYSIRGNYNPYTGKTGTRSPQSYCRSVAYC